MNALETALDKIRVYNARAQQLVEETNAILKNGGAIETEAHVAGLLKRRIRAMMAKIEFKVTFPQDAIFPEKQPNGSQMAVPASLRHDSGCPTLDPFDPGPCTCRREAKSP